MTVAQTRATRRRIILAYRPKGKDAQTALDIKALKGRKQKK